MVKKTTSKKAVTKKTASSKTTSKKTAPKTKKKTAPKKTVLSPSIKSVIKELNELLPELDENEISFLIDQAEVIIHNKKITSQPEIREKRESQFNKKMMDWQASQEEMMGRASVEEGSSGTHFIIVMGNYRNFFARDEMKKVVKLCHAAEDEKDAGRRLFNWFEKNRSDVLKNSAVDSPLDPVLGKVYEIIISTYTTKG